MIIACPSCETRFNVKETLLAPHGRTVRCVNCGHSWHQDPPPSADDEPAEDAALPAGFREQLASGFGGDDSADSTTTDAADAPDERADGARTAAPSDESSDPSPDALMESAGLDEPAADVNAGGFDDLLNPDELFESAATSSDADTGPDPDALMESAEAASADAAPDISDDLAL